MAFVGEQTTIKIPLPKLAYIHAKQLAWYFNQVRLSRFLREFTGSEELDSSFFFGIQGIGANRREAESWKVLREIVVPTRSFFGGIIAVQPTTEDVPVLGKDVFARDNVIRKVMWKAIDERKIRQAGATHTLSNVKNFGMLDGRILFRDFGAPGIPELLMQHKESVRRELQRLSLNLHYI